MNARIPGKPARSDRHSSTRAKVAKVAALVAVMAVLAVSTLQIPWGKLRAQSGRTAAPVASAPTSPAADPLPPTGQDRDDTSSTGSDMPLESAPPNETGPEVPEVDLSWDLEEARARIPRLEPIDRTDLVAPAEDFEALAETAEAEGTVDVTVSLRTEFTPEGLLGEADAAAQRAEIADEQEQVLSVLEGVEYSTVVMNTSIPHMTLRMSPEAVERLEASELAANVHEPEVAEPALSQTTPLIQATGATQLGIDGSGYSIAVIDTGVDSNHPFLGGRVVAEYCFSGALNCPNGSAIQTGTGAALPCTFQRNCDHGTHVAGIAAGQREGLQTFDGAAPDANIVAVNASSLKSNCDLDKDGKQDLNPNGTPVTCPVFSEADQVRALEQIFEDHQEHDIAAVNMSLGRGKYKASCDSTNPDEKDAIDNLLSEGIPTFISSGNDGYTDAIAFPACISSAFAVGATDDNDSVAGFSNSDDQVNLWAPGVRVNSSVPGGGYASKGGTSMAAPHATGAFVALREAFPQTDPLIVLLGMDLHGKSVTDTRNSVTRRRVAIMDTVRAGGLSSLVLYDRDSGDSTVYGLGIDGRLGPHVKGEAWTAGSTIVEPFRVGTKEFLLNYSASTGKGAIHRANSDGTRGTLVGSYTWSTGWTSVEHFTVGSGTFRLWYNATTGTGLVYAVTVDGKNGTLSGNKSWSWSKGWTQVDHVVVGPTTYRLYCNKSTGAWQVRSLDASGLNGATTGSGTNWDKGWTHIRHVTVGATAYRLFYRSDTGVYVIYSVTTAGLNGTKVKSATWSTAWDNVEHFNAAGKTYRLYHRAGTGRVLVQEIKTDATNGPVTGDSTVAPGYDIAIPEFVDA